MSKALAIQSGLKPSLSRTLFAHLAHFWYDSLNSVGYHSPKRGHCLSQHITIPPPTRDSIVVRSFCQDDRKFSDSREDEGMGSGDIKYGDTFVYLQHMKTELWLSYQTFETKKRGVGRVEEKKVCNAAILIHCFILTP